MSLKALLRLDAKSLHLVVEGVAADPKQLCGFDAMVLSLPESVEDQIALASLQLSGEIESA